MAECCPVTTSDDGILRIIPGALCSSEPRTGVRGILIFMLLVLLLPRGACGATGSSGSQGSEDTRGASSTVYPLAATQGKYALGVGGSSEWAWRGQAGEKWERPRSTSDFIFAITRGTSAWWPPSASPRCTVGLACAGLRVARRAPDVSPAAVRDDHGLDRRPGSGKNRRGDRGVSLLRRAAPLVSQGLSSGLVTMLGRGMLMSFARGNQGRPGCGRSGPSPGGRALSWLRTGKRRGSTTTTAAM